MGGVPCKFINETLGDGKVIKLIVSYRLMLVLQDDEPGERLHAMNYMLGKLPGWNSSDDIYMTAKCGKIFTISDNKLVEACEEKANLYADRLKPDESDEDVDFPDDDGYVSLQVMGLRKREEEYDEKVKLLETLEEEKANLFEKLMKLKKEERS